MAETSIVNGGYIPTYNWGHHPVWIFKRPCCSKMYNDDSHHTTITIRIVIVIIVHGHSHNHDKLLYMDYCYHHMVIINDNQ